MSVRIPKGYTLDKNINAKVLRKKRYIPYTIADLLEFFAELDPKTPIWINTYDEKRDDVVIRPVEFLSSATGEHVMIG